MKHTQKRDQTTGLITTQVMLEYDIHKTGSDYGFSYNTSYCQISD